MKNLDFLQGFTSYLLIFNALYAGTWTDIVTALEIQVIHLSSQPFERRPIQAPAFQTMSTKQSTEDQDKSKV